MKRKSRIKNYCIIVLAFLSLQVNAQGLNKIDSFEVSQDTLRFEKLNHSLRLGGGLSYFGSEFHNAGYCPNINAQINWKNNWQFGLSGLYGGEMKQINASSGIRNDQAFDKYYEINLDAQKTVYKSSLKNYQIKTLSVLGGFRFNNFIRHIRLEDLKTTNENGGESLTFWNSGEFDPELNQKYQTFYHYYEMNHSMQLKLGVSFKNQHLKIFPTSMNLRNRQRSIEWYGAFTLNYTKAPDNYIYQEYNGNQYYLSPSQNEIMMALREWRTLGAFAGVRVSEETFLPITFELEIGVLDKNSGYLKTSLILHLFKPLKQ